MQLLGARLLRLGYRAIPAKTPEQAHMVLRMARGAIGAVVLAPDLPVVDLGRTLRFLSQVSPSSPLGFLAAGRPPAPEERARLRAAGVALALFEPLHDHTLRFQINRALAGAAVVRGERRSLRAPTSWEVPVLVDGRRKEARVYTVSATGAFLATPAPSLRGKGLQLEVELAGATRRLAARVVMTNVPGNLGRKALPGGMGVIFERLHADTQARLHLFAHERLEAITL